MTHDLLKTVIAELGGASSESWCVPSRTTRSTPRSTWPRPKARDPRCEALGCDRSRTAHGARIFVDEAVIRDARSFEMTRENVDVGRSSGAGEPLDDDLGK